MIRLRSRTAVARAAVSLAVAGAWPATAQSPDEAVQSIGQAGGTGTAVIEGNGDDTLLVRVKSSGPALLTISRTYHPSWQAEIDGAPVPVIQANHALMAVPLTRSGEHRVLLRYRPRIVQLSAAITATTWLLVLLVTAGGVAVGFRRRRA